MVLSLCCINLIIYTQLTYGVLIQTGKGGLHVTFFFFFFFLLWGPFLMMKKHFNFEMSSSVSDAKDETRNIYLWGY